MQNVVDMQMASARRQDDISRQARQAQAVGAGAFGGSRQAIQEAEANRALGSQLGNIQAQGLQGAFSNAQNQFNTEQQSRAQAAGIGLQGLNTGLQSASTLGQLGQNQYGQETGIAQLQQQFGAGQQAQTQNILNAQQQDFLNAQNYPYKQLSYMSDMLRGAASMNGPAAANAIPAAQSRMQDVNAAIIDQVNRKLTALISTPAGVATDLGTSDMLVISVRAQDSAA
jgi:hypothetical protein